MKNNELRIGNYVQHKGEIVKVEQITKHKIGYHKYADKRTMQYLKYSEIEPIEITEDIVTNCGFKKMMSFFVIEENNTITQSLSFYISITPHAEWEEESSVVDRCWIYNFYGKDSGIHSCINYLHELQNAYFVVNNKELEIKF